MAGSQTGTAISSFVPLQEGAAAAGGLLLIIYLAVLVLVIAGFAKVLQKADQPWWGALVPIYNIYLLLKVTGRPGWWLVLLLIPLVNFVISIIVFIDVAKAFGKGTGFGLGLAFLSVIFLPLLGFGDAQYQGAPN